MRRVIGIRLADTSRIFQAEVGQLAPAPGERVVVKTDGGEVMLGEALSSPELILENQLSSGLQKVMRIATEADVRKEAKSKEKEKEAFQICLRKINNLKIPMRLIQVKCSFDGSRITFYFTADERIDFRQLVKDLAGVFKTRIEMRQIGVRDEAKMLGGAGHCGRALCCKNFLKTFRPVSIHMAREQRLPLDLDKVSGLCGRLMCCLAFEYEMYKDINKTLPKEGSTVQTKSGKGKIISVNALKKKVIIELEDGSRIERIAKGANGI